MSCDVARAAPSTEVVARVASAAPSAAELVALMHRS
jgi:hypothetical protein